MLYRSKYCGYYGALLIIVRIRISESLLLDHCSYTTIHGCAAWVQTVLDMDERIIKKKRAGGLQCSASASLSHLNFRGF